MIRHYIVGHDASEAREYSPVFKSYMAAEAHLYDQGIIAGRIFSFRNDEPGTLYLEK